MALAPVYPKPVPANVARAIDYYQAGGWGSPLTPGQGFRGALANHNVAGDQSISHFNIADNPRIRAEVVREIEAVPQAAARAQKPPPPARKPRRCGDRVTGADWHLHPRRHRRARPGDPIIVARPCHVIGVAGKARP